ncbi:baseplate J-like protein [Haloarcula virus HCTV-15]|nr:baseplate J-like protein [Haloarcula virus HCTV-6]UBF22504.1 baseplate J-like protein [Haloarcula virus HCTV-15]
MTVKNGRFASQSEEEILDAMVADAKEYFGEDLNDTETAIVRTFYRPIAARLAEAQEDIGLVLDSSQIDHASGAALDLLCALIGIRRKSAKRASGEVTFSRDTAADNDYVVKTGTLVQTDSSTPLRFQTTKRVTLAEGNTSVSAPVEAVEGGVDYNLGTNTLTVMPDPPTGVLNVTNTAEITGGQNPESDEDLRIRAKEELAEGSRASAPALINAVQSVQGVTSVAIDIRDAPEDDDGFELTIAGGKDKEIGQAILDTKAVGDTSFGGQVGTAVTVTADLPNGQTHDVTFSRPSEILIYVTADLKVTDEFEGIEAIRDSIVGYLGGITTSGADITGLGVGDDVIYGEVEFAIRSVTGVYDVTSLTVGKSANPTGTDNLTITNTEVASGDATDGSIEVTTTEVTPS